MACLILIQYECRGGAAGAIVSWQWTGYDEQLASAISAHTPGFGNRLWLCGGEIGYVSCRHLKMLSSASPGAAVWNTVSNAVARSRLKMTTKFPGYLTITKGFYALAQNTGGYDPVHSRMCFIALNTFGTTNQCMCCELSDTSEVKCDDLASECDHTPQPCVVHDAALNQLVQFGGYSSQHFFTDVKCFDLNAEKPRFRDGCNYGPLHYGTWLSGCAKVGASEVIVVGGESAELNGYMTTIQICSQDAGECSVSANAELDVGVNMPRVVALSDCLALIAGGSAIVGGRISTSDRMYVYDVCADAIILRDTLPQPMYKFTLHLGNQFLCTIGGLDASDVWIDRVYCSHIDITPSPTPQSSNTNPTPRPTPKPTTKRPTPRPTARPTAPPTTARPTKSPTDKPTKKASKNKVSMDPWSNAYSFSQARSQQICGGDESSLYFFGGMQWSLNGATYISELHEFFKMDADYQVSYYDDVWELKKSLNAKFNMPDLSCSHPCSAYYDKHLFVVMPNSDEAFFDCAIDDAKQELICVDICNDDGLLHPLCEKLGFQPCVTSIGKYLLIVGGSYSSSWYTSILIWNMETGAWVPQSEFSYGQLATGAKATACATWNNNLYVFGGKRSSSTALRTIQVCEPQQDCQVIESTLSVGRYYAQAQNVGKDIVIVCGETDRDEMTDVVDIFDCETHEMSTGPVLSSMRRQCCLADFQGTLFVSGGDILTGSTITGAHTILASEYSLAADDSPPVSTDVPIESCQSWTMTCEEEPIFNGYFNKFSAQSAGYWMWFSRGGVGIYFKPEVECWIGRGSTWAFIPTERLESGEWIAIYEDYTVKFLEVAVQCLDSVQANNDQHRKNERIVGLSVVAFYVILTLVCIIFILACIGIWFVCQRKKLLLNERRNFHTSSKGYSSPSKDKHHNGGRTVTHGGGHGGGHAHGHGHGHSSGQSNGGGGGGASGIISATMMFAEPKSPEFAEDVEHAIQTQKESEDSNSGVNEKDVVFDDIDEDARDQQSNMKIRIASNQLFPDANMDETR